MIWFAFLLLLAAPAHADSGMLLGGVANRQMPLDALPAPSQCYSWRRLRTAYTTNKAMNVVRASDSATLDVGFAPNGDPDAATLAAFLNETTGKVVTAYSQCDSLDLTQGTDSARPGVALNCINAVFPCIQTTGAAQILQSAANVTPATGLISFSVVAQRAAGTANCTIFRQNGVNNRFIMQNAAQQWNIIAGGSGSVVRAASDAAWHAANGVINGVSSVLNIDNGETTGTATGNTTAGVFVIAGVASTTCNHEDIVVWDNYSLSAAERAFLVTNQRTYYGF